MTLYYSTDSSNWSVLPPGMLAGSYEGRFELVYPQASGYSLLGKPVGAFGYPWAELKSTMMPATGMASWLGLFSDPTVLSCSVYMDVWSPYHNALMNVLGYLEYPKWSRVVAYGGAGKFFNDVEIRVNYITTVTAAVGG
jgi:hypothetical protein